MDTETAQEPKAYAIWERFSEATRRKVAAQHYSRHGTDEAGRCPLGVALCEEHHDHTSVPVPDEVAGRLFASDSDHYQEVKDEADAFIDDWDNHVITGEDLPRILGVALPIEEGTVLPWTSL